MSISTSLVPETLDVEVSDILASDRDGRPFVVVTFRDLGHYDRIEIHSPQDASSPLALADALRTAADVIADRWAGWVASPASDRWVQHLNEQAIAEARAEHAGSGVAEAEDTYR